MYLTVFRNRKRPDMDQAAYQADNARMEELAASQPGFIAIKGFVADDGEVVAISEWDSEAAARAREPMDSKMKVVSTGMASDSAGARIQFGALALVNDTMLQIVRSETLRGLEGRALAGFWAGGRVYELDGRTVYVIEKMRHGRRYTTPLEVANEREALAELALFDRDPEVYVTPAEDAGRLSAEAVRVDAEAVGRFLA